MISAASSSRSMNSRNSDSWSTAFSKVMPTSNGIIFESRSAKPKGLSWARATSRTTRRAAIVPKVTIWLTAS